MATASVTNVLVNAATIVASAFNTNFTDLVTFLNNDVLHRDGSKAATGALDMGSQKITSLASGVAATDAATFDQATNASNLASGTVPNARLASDVLLEGDIENVLTSTSTTTALSANQGKNLREHKYGYSGDSTAFAGRRIYIEATGPTGGANGDIWLEY